MVSIMFFSFVYRTIAPHPFRNCTHVVSVPKIKHIITFAFLILSSYLYPQSNRPELRSYLPLQIGNVWNYGGNEIEHVSYISDSIHVGDNVYYAYRDSAIIPTPYTSSKYLRWDSAGSLKYKDNRIWIDFTQATGDTLIYYPDENDSSLFYYQIIISDTAVITTNAGTFDSCLIVLFDNPDLRDDEQTYSFAPGVGIVAFNFNFNPPQSGILRSALINGQILAINKPEPNEDFHLSNNYPNPFNNTSTILFTIPVSSFVTITIYDIRGNKVKSLIAEEKDAGSYRVTWDGTNNSKHTVSSGMYFYRLETDGFIRTKKMVLLK